MKYVAALLLSQIGGNNAPTTADISAILGAVGIEAEVSRIAALLAETANKSAEELIAAGSSKLASMPSGGAAAPAAAAASGSAAAAPAAAKEAAKEESEEDDMGFGLFD